MVLTRDVLASTVRCHQEVVNDAHELTHSGKYNLSYCFIYVIFWGG